jgi:Putative prokaryotic signal transducing protein
MYCPECKGEFKEGITVCPTCNIPLVEKLTPEPEPVYVEWVTVLETGDPALLGVAKSVLETEKIPFFAKGEGLQDLFGAGRIGTGFNPMVGPIQLQVPKEFAKEAERLLADIQE